MPLQVYLYIGISKRHFEYENGAKKYLTPQKTYELDDSDFHVKSWFDRGLLVLGDAADLETETGNTSNTQTGENTNNSNNNSTGNDDTNASNTNGHSGEIPDHVDESDDDWFFFGWSQNPWQIERQDRDTGASSYVSGPQNFQISWANRHNLAYEN